MMKGEEYHTKPLLVNGAKGVMESTTTNSKSRKRNKNLKLKKQKSPLSTQKYFAPAALMGNEHSKFKIEESSNTLYPNVNEAQGGKMVTDVEVLSDLNDSKANNTGDTIQTS